MAMAMPQARLVSGYVFVVRNRGVESIPIGSYALLCVAPCHMVCPAAQLLAGTLFMRRLAASSGNLGRLCRSSARYPGGAPCSGHWD